MSHNQICILCVLSVAIPTGNALAQTINVRELLIDIKIVEKEEAAAKEVRLNWIDQERTRIRDELKDYSSELTELKNTVPDPIRERVVPPAVAKSRERERAAFNDWASNNDPLRHASIMKGAGLNALLRVLGPVAHYRRKRGAKDATSLFSCLSPSEHITELDASHFRMVPATSAGSRVTIRLNQLPLNLQWPPVLLQNWPSDCKGAEKLRDEYVTQIQFAANNTHRYINQAELLDSALSLLQAKTLHKRRAIHEDKSHTVYKRTQIHRDLQEALRYLETVRATAECLKNAPSDYRIHHFPKGNTEEFLEFCYTHGMIFQESRPADQEYYIKMFRRLQDYAHDVQFVEDWKTDLNQRIHELNVEDQLLVWTAAVQ